MLANLRREPDKQEPEPIDATLRMAISVRSQIFTCEVIRPAEKAFLQDLSDRLDHVPARRHSVDFEIAKARFYWEGRRTEELIALGRKTLAEDQETQRAKTLSQTETVEFDSYLESLLREEISTKLSSIVLQMNALRNNRLNVQ